MSWEARAAYQVCKSLPLSLAVSSAVIYVLLIAAATCDGYSSGCFTCTHCSGLVCYVQHQQCACPYLPQGDPATCKHLPCLACDTVGIDTSKPGAIFEEHMVLSHLDPFNPVNCSFGLRDKVFNFGTVIAQLPEGGADASAANSEVAGAAASKADKKVTSAAKAPKAARASITGNPASTASAAAANQSTVSFMDMPGAVKANLKFTNPIKVPCTVNFNIKPRGGHQSGELWVCGDFVSGHHMQRNGLPPAYSPGTSCPMLHPPWHSAGRCMSIYT
eukprot:GHUV01041224.1.p1 GENE.GHUV01041224.1~~GHUV01041224.1.p1  ORF type:complete len:275 (-),score=60.03 GHUV01041224.1:120-944(-)